MTRVYLLWHVHHLVPGPSGVIRHFENDGDYWDEDNDEIKLLGVYSSREAATRRIEAARTLPGFRDEPRCFYISSNEVDEDQWTEGYFTYTYGVEDPPDRSCSYDRPANMPRPSGPFARPGPPDTASQS
jgi:hypothetical protein